MLRKFFKLSIFGLTGLAMGCGSAALQNALLEGNLNVLARLVFSSQPQTTVLGQDMPLAVQVEGRDQENNIIVGANTGVVELSLATNPTGAQLLQNGVAVTTASQNVANGVARFENLRVDRVGKGYTLQARYQIPGTQSVLSTTSEPFDVQAPMVQSVVFLRSTADLWGTNGNSADTGALDAAFGAGNWTLANFETATATDVFQGNRLVFMDGGDNGAMEMADFLTANGDTIRNFVTGGGRVIFNSAPNEGGDFPTQLGPTIHYDGSTTYADQVSVEAAHPIGVACGGNLNFTGSYFGHALVGGDNLTPIIRRTPPIMQTLTPADQVVLAEGRLGSGLFLVGGMTTPNFHSPQPQSNELLANILRYAGGLTLVPLSPLSPQSTPYSGPPSAP